MQETLSQHIIEARRRFPRGLYQPEGSLRFGADALLLAAFAARHLPPKKNGPGEYRADKYGPNNCGPDNCGLENRGPDAANPGPTLVAELGCGCGAALLGLAMLRPHICGLGLERENPLVLAAVNNAALLGLSNHLHFVDLDLADGAALSALCVPAQLSDTMEPRAASSSRHKAGMEQQRGIVQPACNRLDAVLANPPYDRGGRPSPRHMRERALRTTPGADCHASALDTFCRAAAALLRHQGRFFCIYDAQALPRLCVALNAVRLGVRRILPVQGHRDEPARRVLVEARKNAAHDTVLKTPLILHDAPRTNAPGGNAPETRVPGTKAAETNAPDSDKPHNNSLCDNKPCGSRSCAAGPLWSAEALAFCPWLGVADAAHTADNAFTAP